MFPPSRTAGIPPRSLSRTFVAVLALLLSALGGIRLAFDRLGGAEEETTAVVAALAAPQRVGDCSGDLARAPSAVCPAAGALRPRLGPMAPQPLPSSTWRPAAPTTRVGSAGGPRAP